MNLVVDFGNSSVKAALFDGKELKEHYRNVSDTSLSELARQLRPDHLWVASVGRDRKEIAEILGENVEYFTQSTPVPFTNLYATPETLGLDRIAGVAAAMERFPDTSCLIIDAGTCITYDILTEEGKYLGGAISPGLQMKSKAMHIFTARLPLIELIGKAPVTGATTEESMRSGVLNGTIGEMQNFIDHYTGHYPGLKTLLCGGDSNFFENKLKGAIFAAPELVLLGLNRIFLYNAHERI